MLEVGSGRDVGGAAAGPALSADSLARLLLDHPAREGERLLCTIEEEWSKGRFVAHARALASELHAVGVHPGCAVAVRARDPVRMAAGMFATWLAGAVFVPVNSRHPEREVERILASVRPAAVVGGDVSRCASDPAVYGGAAAFVMWTSGTTGTPKPVVQTHSGYREILRRVVTSIRGSTSGERREQPTPNLVPVSLALNAGVYNLLFAFMVGAAVVLMDRFSGAEFATLVSRYGIRSTVLPPAAMVTLTEDDAVTDLAPLRFVRSITAPLSPLAARRFMDKFGVTVLNGYGQAEIGEVVGWTAADAREHPEKLGAAGRPHEGVAIKVVGEDGAPLAAGAPGELLVKPPQMASGYASGESMSERIDAEGYLRTGDYARVDAEGFVWVEGRVSDVINRGGNKVFPDQVEEVIRLHPAIEEAAVVGVPDERLGEVPVAFVVGDASEVELEALCRDNLVPYKVPLAFVRTAALPRSDVGKVLRRLLVDRWLEANGAVR